MNYAKPTALKLLEGNLGKRPLNENEPHPKSAMPKRPSHLDKEAKKYWNAYAPKLLELGILTEMDGPAFGEICQIYSDLQKLTKELGSEGTVFIKKSVNSYDGMENEEKKSNPKFRMLMDLRKEFRYAWGQFGGNPSDRTRLSTNPIKKKDDMESLIK